MRSDILIDRKCVHIKIPKEAHLALRRETLTRGISIQEVFSEFSESVLRGDRFAIKLLDRLALRKVNRQIEAASTPHSVDRRMSNADGETLYGMIAAMLKRSEGDDGNDEEG